MDIFMNFLRVFVSGGLVCLIGQILINKTQMTSARVLVLFLTIGVILEATGAFRYVEGFAGSGVTVPIIGFGASIARGAIAGAKVSLLSAMTAGLANVSGGLTAAIVFGFLFALIFKSKPKKM